MDLKRCQKQPALNQKGVKNDESWAKSVPKATKGQPKYNRKSMSEKRREQIVEKVAALGIPPDPP